MLNVKYPKRFARMPSTETGGETPANKRAGADPHPYLKESPKQQVPPLRSLRFALVGMTTLRTFNAAGTLLSRRQQTAGSSLLRGSHSRTASLGMTELFFIASSRNRLIPKVPGELYQASYCNSGWAFG